MYIFLQAVWGLGLGTISPTGRKWYYRTKPVVINETTDGLDPFLSDLLVVGQLVEELADVADAAQRRDVQVGQDLDQDL